MASASAGSGIPGAGAALLARRAAAAGDGRSSSSSSAFSLTCSRLSQYLKEKGSLGLGGIGLDMGRAFDATAANKGITPTSRPDTPRTMNLLPGIDSFNADHNQLPAAAAPPTEKHLIPSSTPAPPQPQQPRGAQMTIFYGGKVIVFNNYPADKAKDILVLAGMGLNTAAVPTPTAAASVSLAVKPAPLTPPRSAAHAAIADTHAAVAATPVPASAAPVLAAPAAQDRRHMSPPQASPTVAVASDLPIARRNSLNRFLEKRKDRITSKAPYPPVNTAAATASSSDSNPLPDKDAKQHQQPAMPPLSEKEKSAMMPPLPLKEKDKQQSWLGLAPSDSL